MVKTIHAVIILIRRVDAFMQSGTQNFGVDFLSRKQLYLGDALVQQHFPSGNDLRSTPLCPTGKRGWPRRICRIKKKCVGDNL